MRFLSAAFLIGVVGCSSAPTSNSASKRLPAGDANICDERCRDVEKIRSQIEQFVKSQVETIKNVSIKSYDCSLPTVASNYGKCMIEIDPPYKGKLLASPEVAAPYSNSYGSIESRPMSSLTMMIQQGNDIALSSTKPGSKRKYDIENEIVMILDSEGRTIAKKIDFSR